MKKKEPYIGAPRNYKEYLSDAVERKILTKEEASTAPINLGRHSMPQHTTRARRVGVSDNRI